MRSNVLKMPCTDPESPDPTAALCELHRRNGEFASPSEVRTMDAFNGLLARAIYMLPHHGPWQANDDQNASCGLSPCSLGVCTCRFGCDLGPWWLVCRRQKLT